MNASTNKNSCQLVVKSSTENLVLIRDFLSAESAQRGIDKSIIDKMILAVDEASSNIMRHAYRNDPEKEIVLTILFSVNECKITLTDHGIGFNPNGVRRPDMPTYLKEKRVGGLGMHLMKMLMDNVEYNSENDGSNQLILTKKIA